MKRGRQILKRIIVLIVLLFLLPSTAFAHSGGTDANGGHYVGGTDEYHYHHGYPAHDHPNGVCPYDFDDRTGQSSGSSGSGKTTSALPTPTPTPKPEKKEPSLLAKIGAFLLCTLFGFPIVYLVCWGIYSVTIGAYKERKRLEQQQIEEQRALEQFNRERDAFFLDYQGLSLSAIYPPPIHGAFIGEDGLPSSPGEGRWGPHYTVFVSGYRAQVFHKKRKCGSVFGFPINLAQTGSLRPCSRCWNTPVPDLTWYYEQRELLNKCRHYGVTPFVEQIKPPDAPPSLPDSSSK